MSMVGEDPNHEQTPRKEDNLCGCPIGPHREDCSRGRKVPGIIAKPTVDFAEISRRRKQQPVHDGFMLYFPDAMMAVAEFSRLNNEKHNPGERLHWSKHKSNDHGNCVARHAIDIGPDWDAIDEESGRLHAEALAWRSMALLQIVLLARRAGMKPQAYLAKLKAEAEAK